MNALDWLRERASKKEAELKRQKKEKEGKERKLQRVREEAFRTTGAIYIEHLHQGHLLYFEKVMRFMGKKEMQNERFFKH